MGSHRRVSKMFSLLAVVTLLSSCYSPASSFVFLPRVSRTNDAIIIDFAGVGYAPSYHGKTWNGQIAYPGFVPLPSLNPYPMTFRQQQQGPLGWSYSFGYPSPIVSADVSPSKQGTGATPAIQCGKGPTALPKTSFIGGRVAGSGATSAKNNAWPFLVTLKKHTAIEGIYFCSGTLISDSKVILAANCLEKMSLFEISGVTVMAGLTPTLNQNSHPYPTVQMTRRISKVVLHSQYNAFTYANDVAIITLDAPVVLSKSVGPVCLAPTNTDPDQYADQSAVILGWTTPATDPSTLNQGAVAVSLNSDCKADTKFGKYVTDANICISATDKFICPGDIGGPVLVLSSPGIWTQIGINSFTSSTDCTTNSLQTRVSAFRTWIDTYSTN